MTDREIMDYQRRKISQLKEENRALKERLRVVTEEQRVVDAEDAMVFAMVNGPAVLMSDGCTRVVIRGRAHGTEERNPKQGSGGDSQTAWVQAAPVHGGEGSPQQRHCKAPDYRGVYGSGEIKIRYTPRHLFGAAAGNFKTKG